MTDLKGEPLIALKGRFRAPNSRYYAQFFFLINQKNGFIDAAAVVVSPSAELFNALTPTDHWKKFETFINKLKYENKYSQSITTEFQERLKQLTTDKQFFADLMKSIHTENEEAMKFLIGGFYRRVIKDDEFVIDVAVDKASFTDDAAQTQSDPVHGAAVAESGSYLNIKLDLDPIAGKDVKQVRPGDKIFVRILPQSDQANAFIDSAGLRSESGFIKSAPFIITSVTYPGVGVELVGKLSDGVYGKIVEEQNVLIRVAESTKKNTTPTTQTNAAATSSSGNQVLFMGLGVLGIAILAIILYFVLS